MTDELLGGHPATSGDDAPLTVTTLFRHVVRTHGDQEIVYRTADGGWDRYTFAEYGTRVSAIASALADIGVAPGDVVGVLDWNSKRHFELYGAVPLTGAVLLQMNLRLAPSDLAYVTTHAKATVVLVDESLLDVAEAIAPLATGVRRWVVMTDRPVEELQTTLPDVTSFEELVVPGTPPGTRPRLLAGDGGVGGLQRLLHHGDHRAAQGRLLLSPSRLPARHDACLPAADGQRRLCAAHRPDVPRAQLGSSTGRRLRRSEDRAARPVHSRGHLGAPRRDRGRRRHRHQRIADHLPGDARSGVPVGRHAGPPAPPDALRCG